MTNVIKLRNDEPSDTIFWMVFLFEGTTKIVVLLLHFKNYIILVVNHIDS